MFCGQATNLGIDILNKQATAMVINMNISGTWRLLSWICTLDGKDHSCSFGRKAKGTLIYTSDGYMSAILMQPERSTLTYPNSISGSDDEKIAAATGYISYAGTYHLDGPRVVHQIELSLLPNWIGTELVGEMQWVQDNPTQMVLTTLPEQTHSGKMVVNRLQWEKRSE